MKNKTILCAIDFSESSVQAMQWATRMAQLTESHVIFLFCYRLIGSEDEANSSDFKRRIETDAIKKYNEMQQGLLSDNGVTSEFVSEVGFFPLRIENFIRKDTVNMLVLGNSIVEDFNEYRNLNFDLFLKNAKIPVVVVPALSGQTVHAPGPSKHILI